MARYSSCLQTEHDARSVSGQTTARLPLAGTIVHVDNRYLAVWLCQHDV
jgi:hypothetical protein